MANERLSARTWLILGLTYLTYSLMYCTRKPISVVKSTMKQDTNLTKAAGGSIDYPLIETSFFLMYMCGQFCIGILSQRLSTKAYLLLSIFGSATTCALFGMVSSNAFMTTFWAANGFSQSAVNTLLVNFLADIVPLHLRSSILGVWNSCLQVGGVMANNFAALAVDITGNWRSAFTYPALALAVAGASLAVILPSKQATPSKSTPETDQTIATEDNGKPSALDPLKVPGVANLALGYLLIKFVRYSLMFNLAEYLQSIGYSQTSAAMMASVFDFAGIFGSMASGVVADRCFGGRVIMAVSPMCIACGACIVALVYTANVSVTACAITMGLAGFFIAGPDGIQGGPAPKYMCDYTGKSKAMGKAACGFVNGVASLGTCFQSYVGAYMVNQFGWSAYFTSMGGLISLATFASMPTWKVEQMGLQRQLKKQQADKTM